MGKIDCIRCGSQWYGDTYGINPDTYLCPACRFDEEKEGKQQSLDFFNK